MKRLFLLIGLTLAIAVVSFWFSPNAGAVQVLLNPMFQQFTDDGEPLAGGKVYTYAAGTTTPKAVYSDADNSTPLANPIVLDSRGDVGSSVYLNGSYKILLTDSDGVTIWTVDNVKGYGSSIMDFVLLSDYTSLANAVSVIGATEIDLWIDEDAVLTDNIIIPKNINLRFINGSVISGAYTLQINGPIEAGLFQIFGSTTTVDVDVDGYVQNVWQVEWWGAASMAESSAGIQAAIDFGMDAHTGTALCVKIKATNIYYIDTQINIDGRGLIFENEGQIIQSDSTNLTQMFYITDGEDHNITLNIDGNFTNNATSTYGILFDDAWSRSSHAEIRTNDCNNAVKISGDTEGWDMTIYTNYNEATGCIVYTDGDDSPGRNNITLYCTESATAFSGWGGFSITNLKIFSSADVAVKMASGSKVYVSGEIEGSEGAAAIETDGSSTLVATELYIRNHDNVGGYIVEDHSGLMRGSIYASGTDGTNGVLLCGDSNGDLLSVMLSGKLAVGLTFGDADECAMGYNVEFSGEDDIVNQHVLFYNARYIILDAKEIRTPTDGTSASIDISDDVATDDIYIKVRLNQHSYEIVQDGTATRNVVEYLGYVTSTMLAAIPNLFEGMVVPSYRYASPTYRMDSLYVDNNDVWVYENFSAGIILDTNTDVIITHGLGVAPVSIILTPNDAETVGIRAHTLTATTFTVSATAAVTDDRMFWWRAKN